MKIKLVSAGVAVVLSLSAAAWAAMDPMVGGAAMYPSKNIVENAVNSQDHTTLVAAVKAAGLVTTLESPGPFTVFAPTNEAFAALPAGTVDGLLKPESKPELTKILTYHVVPGRYDATTLEHDVQSTPGGRVSLKTVEGEALIVSWGGDALWITDQKGNSARITIPDVYQSNGVIMVVDKVLMP
jgi:uncharacterized surface protein with fasciclin (FAS1) repeats